MLPVVENSKECTYRRVLEKSKCTYRRILKLTLPATENSKCPPLLKEQESCKTEEKSSHD
jgi:hypothetical protein